MVSQASHEFSRMGFLQGTGYGVEVRKPPVGVDRTPPEFQTGDVERTAVVAQAKVSIVVHAQREAVGLRVLVEVGARGLDGDVHDFGVAGAGLTEQAVADGVTSGDEALAVDEGIVFGVRFAVLGNGEDSVEGVVEAGVGQFSPAAGDAVAVLPAMALQSGDAAEDAVEEVGGFCFVNRRDFQGGLHRDVFKEFPGHKPAGAEVVFQQAVDAVGRAAVASAQDEEVPAGGDDAVSLHACISGVQGQRPGVCGFSHVDRRPPPGRGLSAVHAHRGGHAGDFFKDGLQIGGRIPKDFSGAFGQDNGGSGLASVR